MSATQADGGLSQNFADKTKSSTRKRKQELDHDLATSSTPSKASKRVKAEASGPLSGSPRPRRRPRSHNQKNLIRDVTPETDSVPQEERTPIAAKKTSKEKREAESNGKTNLDEALVVTPVET